MRLKKPYGPQGRWPLLRAGVRAFVADWPQPVSFHEIELQLLLSHALDPERLPQGTAPINNMVRRIFCSLYARNPDFVLALLAHIRSEWNRFQKTEIKQDLCIRLLANPRSCAIRKGKQIVFIEEATDKQLAEEFCRLSKRTDIVHGDVKQARRILARHNVKGKA